MDYAFYQAFTALADRVEALEDAVFEDEESPEGDGDSDESGD